MSHPDPQTRLTAALAQLPAAQLEKAQMARQRFEQRTLRLQRRAHEQTLKRQQLDPLARALAKAKARTDESTGKP